MPEFEFNIVKNSEMDVALEITNKTVDLFKMLDVDFAQITVVGFEEHRINKFVQIPIVKDSKYFDFYEDGDKPKYVIKFDDPSSMGVLPMTNSRSNT